MTKTIKRSLIVVLMFVFAVTACAFTSTFTVKADTEDPAAAAAEFKSIVDSWNLYDTDTDPDKNIKFDNLTILTDMDATTAGAQWLISSAELATKAYANGKSLIDNEATYAEAKGIYDDVMKLCKKALDYEAELNQLNKGLGDTNPVTILYSEKDAFAELKAVSLNSYEQTYIAEKFKTKSAAQIIADVQARFDHIANQSQVANDAIADIETFSGVALLASGESLNKAIEELTKIYTVEIEKIFKTQAVVDGTPYLEDVEVVETYIPNIEQYIALKAQYDAEVAKAEAVIKLIVDLTAKVDSVKDDDTVAYKYLEFAEGVDGIEALIAAYEALDDSADNNLKGYVDEDSRVKYVDYIDDNDTPDDESDDFEVYGSRYDDLYDGLYQDEIDYLIGLVLQFPAKYATSIVDLMDAIDEYDDKFAEVLTAQQDAVNAKVLPDGDYDCDGNTIKALYNYYKNLVTEPTLMVKYAEEAIDAIPLEGGVYVMSVANLPLLTKAQELYGYVVDFDKALAISQGKDPATFKYFQNNVKNSKKLFDAEAAMEADLAAVRVWAEKVYAIYATETETEVEGQYDIAYNKVTVSNMNKVDEAKAYFESDSIKSLIRGYINDQAAFRAIVLKNVPGSNTDQTIQSYYTYYNFALDAKADLLDKIADIAADMGTIEIKDATNDFNYTKNNDAALKGWIIDVTDIETDYTTDDIAPNFGYAYDDAAKEYLKTNYAVEYARYDKAIAMRARYTVELYIEEMIEDSPNDPITFDAAKELEKVYVVVDGLDILDECYIVAIRKAYETLDLAKGGAVRNLDKLAACETALAPITEKLNKFVAAVNALLDESLVDAAINLDLDAYKAAIEVRDNKLSADEQAYTGEYPELNFFGKTIKFDFSNIRNVKLAINNLEVLRKAAVKNINDLTADLIAVTGEWIKEDFDFDDLYERYMALHVSQRNELNEAVLAPDASIIDLRDAYAYASSLVSTNAILGLEERINALELDSATKAELLNKITELKGLVDGNGAAIEEINEMIDSLESKIAELEAADEELQAQIDSTRTLAIVSLVIAIVGLCAAAFVIVYKVILKK